MHIENCNALHSWLTRVLSTKCCADPNILSKYIIALLRKNRSESQLRESCLLQLEIFLTSSTESFVDELFDTLRSKQYLLQEDDGIATTDGVNIVKPASTLSSVVVRSCPVNSGCSAGSLKSVVMDDVLKSHMEDERSVDTHNQHDKKSKKRTRLNDKHQNVVNDVADNGKFVDSDQVDNNVRSNIEKSSFADDKPLIIDERKSKKPLCRDFNEVGYCVLGDCCPYDHGLNPVTVNSVTSTTRRNGQGSGSAGELNQIQAVVSMHGNTAYKGPYKVHRQSPDSSSDPNVYNPERPFVRPYHDNKQRNIITLVSNDRKSKGHWAEPTSHKVPQSLRNITDYSSSSNLENEVDKCTLRVSRIPLHCHNIASIHDYFSKFGNVVHAEISQNTFPNSAIVSFSSAAGAQAAIQNKDVLFNDSNTRVSWCTGTPSVNSVSDKKNFNRVDQNNQRHFHRDNVAPLNRFIDPRLFKTVRNRPPKAAQQVYGEEVDHVDCQATQRLHDQFLNEQKRLVKLLDNANTDKERSEVIELLKTVMDNLHHLQTRMRSQCVDQKRYRTCPPTSYDQAWEAATKKYRYKKPLPTEAAQETDTVRKPVTVDLQASGDKNCTVCVSHIPSKLIRYVELMFRELNVDEIKRIRDNELIATFRNRSKAEAVVNSGIKIEDHLLLVAWHSPNTSRSTSPVATASGDTDDVMSMDDDDWRMVAADDVRRAPDDQKVDGGQVDSV